MVGGRITLKKASKDEAEKPFWISYADLMTSLMVLFLVVMSVALLAVTKKIDEIEVRKKQHEDDIRLLFKQIEQAASEFPGMRIDMDRKIIDFGPQANFKKNEYSISAETALLLRAFVPKLLDIARQSLGQKVLKRVVVEGFTSSEGSYLYNLDLSLNRSHNVLCVLLKPSERDPTALSVDDQEEVRKLFLVGGYSFNSVKNTPEESRRIELRLEVFGFDEKRERPTASLMGNFGKCQLR